MDCTCRTLEEKQEYQARFLKIRERKSPVKKKPVNIVLPVELTRKIRQTSILAGINNSCFSHIVANILEDHLHEYADVIRDLFADEGIVPR